MTKPLKQIELDPETWIRGGDYGNAFLLRHSDGKMCCMGFASEAYGVDLENMSEDICQVEEIKECPAPLMTVKENESKVYDINDDSIEDYSDEMRVLLLNNDLIKLDAPFRFFLKGEK